MSAPSTDAVPAAAASPRADDLDPLLSREWLVTNGLGGYASGTVLGLATRRYHGLLIAALPAPFGRTMMVNHLMERVRLPGGDLVRLDADPLATGRVPRDLAEKVVEFRLQMGLPSWRVRVGDFVVEKTVWMSYRQNTVNARYRLVGGEGTLRLKLQPCVHFRPHDAPVDAHFGGPYALRAQDGRYEVSDPEEMIPPLRMHLVGSRAAFTMEPRLLEGFTYLLEKRRGYEHVGSLWAPGYFRVDLDPARPATLVLSTEPWETVLAMGRDESLRAERLRREHLLHEAHPAARTGLAAELVLAADQFIIAPAGRREDEARVHASGDEARTVIAGYHWFTDWGRDTMISLEGLALTTGRTAEAGYILRTFAHYLRDGLIPNLFPEGRREALYHTADATLWWFHAIHRYVQATEDHPTLLFLLPRLVEVARFHLNGTRFGIGVDPHDGLLRQGTPALPLTWMDAKVGDWVVTPRRGKAVEINALWYNALSLLAAWLDDPHYADRFGDVDSADRLPRKPHELAREFAEHAARARESFNRRFWCAERGHLYDVVDGDEGDHPACTPNQVLAISLDHPVLDPERWTPVLDVVTDKLLTPFGLRTLAPDEPDYKQRYDGDLRARDAAYHQGTVWAWLAGPYVDAWLRAHPGDVAGARRVLGGFDEHATEACLGTISEVFDAEEPHAPRGCVAQAWSVAEVLRGLVRTERTRDDPPKPRARARAARLPPRDA